MLAHHRLETVVAAALRDRQPRLRASRLAARIGGHDRKLAATCGRKSGRAMIARSPTRAQNPDSPDSPETPAPEERPPAGEPPSGPGELGRAPADAIAPARVRVPTRGNRRLEALLANVNADPEVKAWWHMAQIQSERLGMSDHSWVHVQIVAQHLPAAAAAAGQGRRRAGDGHRPRDARPRRRGGGRRRRAAARRRDVHPPRRPRGVQPLPRRAQAARAARRRLRRPPSARW